MLRPAFHHRPEGSDTRFTTVSDQSYRAFHVRVNGDFSENGYSKLYVPCGSSEQPNTITVKTNTKLLYYLADGERFPVLDSDSDSYIYQIPVQNFEKIVLVTEEPSAPPTDNPGELDPAFSSAGRLYPLHPSGAGKRPVDDCRQARPCKHRTVYRYPR